MKWLILIRTLGAPVMLAIILFVRLHAGSGPFDTVVQGTFLASVLFGALLSDQKYVRTFTVSGDRLIITYYTPLLQSRSIAWALSDVTEVQLSKKAAVAVWLPSVRVRTDEACMPFDILTREIYNEIEAQQASVQRAFVK